MSSNVYEEPKRTMAARYGKVAREEDEERAERLVDIYESGANFAHCPVVPTPHRGPRTQRPRPVTRRNSFRAAALVLGLLCLLLLVGVAVLSKLYISVILTNQPPGTSDNGEVKDYCSQEKDDQTDGNKTRWLRFQRSCYYVSTEVKMWEESKRDCESRQAHLVVITSREENEHVSLLKESGDSWIGLQSVQRGWNPEWQWQWVDESTPQYLVWSNGVKTIPTSQVFVYMDQQGHWNYTDNGTKNWICEKPIN